MVPARNEHIQNQGILFKDARLLPAPHKTHHISPFAYTMELNVKFTYILTLAQVQGSRYNSRRQNNALMSKC